MKERGEGLLVFNIGRGEGDMSVFWECKTVENRGRNCSV